MAPQIAHTSAACCSADFIDTVARGAATRAAVRSGCTKAPSRQPTAAVDVAARAAAGLSDAAAEVTNAMVDAGGVGGQGGVDGEGVAKWIRSTSASSWQWRGGEVAADESPTSQARRCGGETTAAVWFACARAASQVGVRPDINHRPGMIPEAVEATAHHTPDRAAVTAGDARPPAREFLALQAAVGRMARCRKSPLSTPGTVAGDVAVEGNCPRSIDGSQGGLRYSPHV